MNNSHFREQLKAIKMWQSPVLTEVLHIGNVQKVGLTVLSSSLVSKQDISAVARSVQQLKDWRKMVYRPEETA